MARLERRDIEAFGTVAAFAGLTVWSMSRGRSPASAAAEALVILAAVLFPLYVLSAVVNRRRRRRQEEDSETHGDWRPGRTFSKVEEARRRGEVWRAKEILQGTVGSQAYDPDLYEWYGRVLREMGDLPNAGKYLFLSGRRDETYQAAISLFLDRFRGRDVGELVRVLPSRARDVRRLPPHVVEELTQMGWKPRQVAKASERYRRGPRARSSGLDQVALTVAVLAFIMILVLGFLEFRRLVEGLSWSS